MADQAERAQDAAHRHVLVVPAVPEGHVNSLLSFALLLAQRGLLVSFGYPARPHALALKRNKLSALPSSLRVHVINDGYPLAEHELTTGSHFEGSVQLMRDGIEIILQQYLATANMQALRNNEAFSLVSENGSSTSLTWPPICCIISDTFLPGSQGLADKFCIPRVDFWTCNATIYDMVVHLPEITARGLLPLPEGVGDKWIVDAPLVDFIPGLPAFHLTELPRELLEATDVSNFSLSKGSMPRVA
ncbi:hypothetical protein GOP47_0028217 [Adiantum capillus-veneris]|nr:hypothetical protein GOP47_0028217 [Adiantum capillus-veneris]